MANGWKKDRDRYYKEKLRQYEQISKDYGLGLKWEEYQPPAWEYADRKAQSEKNWFESIFSGGNIFSAILNILVVTLSIALSFVTLGSTFLISLSIIGGTLTLANYVYSSLLVQKLEWLSIQADMIASKTGALKAHNDAKEQSDMITHILIYNPYEMFANGSIYKSQSAGEESYSPSIFPDTNKGILGTFKKDPLDEFNLNRAQVQKAGGNGFFSYLLDHKTPIEKFSLPTQSIQDILENNMRRANERITEGFTKLNELYFNILGTAERVYRRVFKEQVECYWTKMIQNDFLEKNKNYSKGLRADFNYLHRKHFKGIKKSEEEIAKEFEKLLDHYKFVQESPLYSLEAKAQEYYASILFLYYKIKEVYGENKITFFPFEPFYPLILNYNTNYYFPQGVALIGEILKYFEKIKPRIEELMLLYKKEKDFKNALKHLEELDNILNILDAKNKEIMRYKRRFGIGGNDPTVNDGFNKTIGELSAPFASYLFSYPLRADLNLKLTHKAIIFNEFFKSLESAKPSEVVLFYERHIRGRFFKNKIVKHKNQPALPNGSINDGDGGSTPQYIYLHKDLSAEPYILLLENQKNENLFGFFGLKERDYKLYSRDLPKNKDLESFDFKSLDG
ncbi:hypothetical protein B6S12_04975 [Helicobacter valdiviensis]|uniref:Uncharacterized protein n=1 Tax=Helicobacter valdiviensis TaxID=1458358 RepID=A0A2W6MUH1_9HELI|nr:hypothetical protein [Helicobacter valdiviensis]PZT48175.1 hypothetical protein B6S12_04975 [Helicobacter valdiviensis]